MQGRAKTQGKEKRAKIEFLVAGNFKVARSEKNYSRIYNSSKLASNYYYI